jgi:uncharacterized protein (DUF58 family)
MKIFDETSLRKLEQLTLVADRVRVGVMKGERRSRKRGTSIEFADYRNYTQGDDLRRLDWNVFARLERPFIKLLEEEEDLGVHLLVDSSLSMDWPDEDAELNKLNYAVRLAGALAHIGLAAGDQVTVTLLRSTGNERWGPYRGRHNTLRLLQFLENGRASGITDLNIALRNYALQSRRPGLLFVLSDLFSPGGYREGLNALQSRGYEVGLLHVLSPDENDPPVGGDVKLVDIETGADAEITLDTSTLDMYRERFQEWQAEISAYCQNRGVHYIPITTDYPWDRLVMQTLRAKGLVS